MDGKIQRSSQLKYMISSLLSLNLGVLVTFIACKEFFLQKNVEKLRKEMSKKQKKVTKMPEKSDRNVRIICKNVKKNAS